MFRQVGMLPVSRLRLPVRSTSTTMRPRRLNSSSLLLPHRSSRRLLLLSMSPLHLPRTTIMTNHSSLRLQRRQRLRSQAHPPTLHWPVHPHHFIERRPRRLVAFAGHVWQLGEEDRVPQSPEEEHLHLEELASQSVEVAVPGTRSRVQDVLHRLPPADPVRRRIRKTTCLPSAEEERLLGVSLGRDRSRKTKLMDLKSSL